MACGAGLGVHPAVLQTTLLCMQPWRVTPDLVWDAMRAPKWHMAHLRLNSVLMAGAHTQDRFAACCHGVVMYTWLKQAHVPGSGSASNLLQVSPPQAGVLAGRPYKSDVSTYSLEMSPKAKFAILPGRMSTGLMACLVQLVQQHPCTCCAGCWRRSTHQSAWAGWWWRPPQMLR